MMVCIFGGHMICNCFTPLDHGSGAMNLHNRHMSYYWGPHFSYTQMYINPHATGTYYLVMGGKTAPWSGGGLSCTLWLQVKPHFVVHQWQLPFVGGYCYLQHKPHTCPPGMVGGSLWRGVWHSCQLVTIFLYII